MHRLPVAIVIGFVAAPAFAQFDSPPNTAYRSRIVGVVTTETGAPTISSGDEIAAVFNGVVVGLQRFSGAGAGTIPLSLTVIGDDPDTPVKEGPARGEIITFQFFDNSTGMIRNNVVALNSAGEVSTVRFEGEFIDFDIPLPPELLVPVQESDLRLTAQDNSPGGGNGGGGSSQGDPDVNNDGSIDKRDVALVLRIVVGNTRRVTDAQRGRADVNGDGAVTTDDAVLIFREM